MSRLIKEITASVVGASIGKAKAFIGKLVSLPGAASKKIVNALKNPLKHVFGKPDSIDDYVRLHDVFISKRLMTGIAAGTVIFAFFIVKYAIPYIEGKLWIPTIIINSAKYHTYEGKANVVSRDGSLIYKGDLESGTVAGYGVLFDKENLAYEGRFAGNKFDGYGKLYYASGGVKFAGVFEAGQYKDGTLYYEDGAMQYEGAFDGGSYSEGRLYYEDGALCYDGAFLDGEFNGLGKLYEGGELLYEGEFVSNAYNGTGTLYRSGRIMYEGEFSNNLFNGLGKLYTRERKLLYEGDFLAGLYDGNGTQYFEQADRELYRGFFSEGLYHGDGVLYDERGMQIYTGAFYKGEINYIPYVDGDVELVRKAFGKERKLEMLEKSFLMFYDGMDVIFEFSFADEEEEPKARKIKLFGVQKFSRVSNGMSIESFKKAIGGSVFTEYFFDVNSEDEISFAYAGSGLKESETAYCVKFDLESVYIRVFAENETGGIIYFEIGGI